MVLPDLSDGPAWPVGRCITPTALHHFGTCPRRVRLKYIDCRPEPFTFNLHLIKGRIAHEILRERAWLVARDKPVLGDVKLYSMVSLRFRPRDFPAIATMESHVADVVRWVRFGIECLDRDSQVLVIERASNRPVTLPAISLSPTLMARSDLIVLRREPDGGPFVEFIDYKTGKPTDDEIVPVFTRYIARALLKRHLPNPTIVPMQFTFLWLDTRERQVIDLSLDYCEWAWESVKRQIGALLEEREWPERPSYLCRYCPYNGNACTAYDRLQSDNV